MLLDKYVWGKVHRISPEAPIQILNVGSEEYRPGGAANVASNLRAMGAEVLCAGCTGSDQNGQILKQLLVKRGIKTHGILYDPTRPTPLKTRMIAHSQQVLRVDHESTIDIPAGIASSIARYCNRVISDCDLVLLSDYNKGTLTPRLCQKVISISHRYGKPIIAGPKQKEIQKYRGLDGAILNQQEMQQIGGSVDHRGAQRVMRKLKLRFLVITLGDRGMTLFQGSRTPFHLPALAKEVYDVTGAGDTVLAVFGMVYAAGYPLGEALRVANAAASIVVGKVGADVVTREEIKGIFLAGGSAGSKIVGESELIEVVKAQKARGKKIVFTNGCFDILHPGHLRVFNFAKSQGDVLIVGLNSDRSVRGLKGPGRPIMAQDHRAQLVSALEMVDYVVVFDEPTPLRLIKKIRPEVLVKGADWDRKGVVGSDVLKSYGGRVKLVPLLEGISTTQLITRVRDLSGSGRIPRS